MTDLRRVAWERLNQARLSFQGHDVGVSASVDRRHPKLNYDYCFVRDFAVCAPAFLLRGDHDIVRDFLVATLHLQGREEVFEAFRPRKGLMPASFRPESVNGWPLLEGDYGEESIARVTPVDSVFWWLLTLRAYTVATGDRELARDERFQEGIRLIVHLTLQGSFEVLPAIIVPEGSFMIDRRMGVYGHPLEVQVLFFAALRAADELLDADSEWREPIRKRLRNLEHHVDEYYWIDRKGLADLRGWGRDQYGEQVVNVFNVFPESIPGWVHDWIPEDAGYYAGNVGPGRIDFRFFTQGNLLAVASGLSGPERNRRLMNLFETHWDHLVGDAPLRIVHPALEGDAWIWVTGGDEKNRPWQYHNGGCWPCLLWSFALATVTCGRTDLLGRAVEAAEARWPRDDWPEYYDGRSAPRPGERSRSRQSWTLGAYLFARACLEDPGVADLYRWSHDIVPERASVRDRRGEGAERVPESEEQREHAGRGDDPR